MLNRIRIVRQVGLLTTLAVVLSGAIVASVAHASSDEVVTEYPCRPLGGDPSAFTCEYSSSGQFIVPPGVTSIDVEAESGQGRSGSQGHVVEPLTCSVLPGSEGGSGGRGVRVRRVIDVTPGDVLDVEVGGELAGGLGAPGVRAEGCFEPIASIWRLAHPGEPVPFTVAGHGGAGGDGAGLRSGDKYLVATPGGGGGGGGGVHAVVPPSLRSSLSVVAAVR